MENQSTTTRHLLLRKLEESDARRRIGRADRLEWLVLHKVDLPAVMGRPETMQLLREARDVFVDGHFVASLLVALSFIEHALVEELQMLGHIKGSPPFGVVIKTAQKMKTFPADWLARTETLSLLRNAFAHLKAAEHPDSLGNRIREESRHPNAIVETDAKDAIELMYNFFVATLREDMQAII